MNFFIHYVISCEPKLDFFDSKDELLTFVAELGKQTSEETYIEFYGEGKIFPVSDHYKGEMK